MLTEHTCDRREEDGDEAEEQVAASHGDGCRSFSHNNWHSNSVEDGFAWEYMARWREFAATKETKLPEYEVGVIRAIGQVSVSGHARLKRGPRQVSGG